MALSYTFLGVQRPRDGIAGPNLGNAVAVADAAASAALAGGFYRIVATSSSLVQIKEGAANGASGEVWASGRVEIRQVPGGWKIGCSAGA